MWSSYARIRPGETFKFRCIGCDYCCGTGPNVSLTVFDVIRIARYLKMHWRQVLESFVKVIIADILPFMSLRDTGNGECVFMERVSENKARCRIYEARPLKCRLYPLILPSPSVDHLYLDTKCPGVGEDSVARVPVKLVQHYSWELKEHYRRVAGLVLEEGLEPLEALYRVLDELWAEAWSVNPRWADLKYIESLGYT